MPTIIEVFGIIPDVHYKVPESARAALMHGVFEADGEAVAAIRAEYPDLPRVPNTYEVVYTDLRPYLIAKGRFRALEEWDLFRRLIIRIPYDCAEVVAAKVSPRAMHRT